MTGTPKTFIELVPESKETYIRCYFGLSNAQLRRGPSAHWLRLYEHSFRLQRGFGLPHEGEVLAMINPMMKVLHTHTYQRR